MNPLYFISKKFYAAWLEANRPLFPDSPENDYFYTELFNYYRSRKDRIIDTHNGESLFPVATDRASSIKSDHLHINKTQRRNQSETSFPAGFKASDWKPA